MINKRFQFKFDYLYEEFFDVLDSLELLLRQEKSFTISLHHEQDLTQGQFVK